MKVSFDFNALISNLADLALVAEDSMSGEDMKNIIFRFKKDGSAEMIALNQLVVFKRLLSHESYSTDISDSEFGDKDSLFMQIKSKELISYLSTYKSLKRTSVESVELELVNNLTIACKVAEKDLMDGNVYISNYTLPNTMIKPNLLPRINLVAPQGAEQDIVSVDRIQCYSSAMLPVMKNDTNLYGSLVFGTDKCVVAFNAAFLSFMVNMLPDTFSGIKLSYRALSFIDKIFAKKPASTSTTNSEPSQVGGLDLLGGSEAPDPVDADSPMVSCMKFDNYLYIKSADTDSEAFIVFDTKMPAYSQAKETFVKEHYFVLDRLYLRDILKRLSLANERIEFKIKCNAGEVEVKNTKFSQNIPILDMYELEDYNEISFKILPEALNKSILGADDRFSDKLYVYYCPQKGGDAVLIFSDSDSMWFSALRVKPFK